jgi:hypothetical protein
MHRACRGTRVSLQEKYLLEALGIYAVNRGLQMGSIVGPFDSVFDR